MHGQAGKTSEPQLVFDNLTPCMVQNTVQQILSNNTNYHGQPGKTREPCRIQGAIIFIDKAIFDYMFFLQSIQLLSFIEETNIDV